MWKRISRSLTLRIFLITCALLLSACAMTYGAIAYLTPMTYTTLLADELEQESEKLLRQLKDVSPDGCAPLLTEFSRRTGAYIRLTGTDGVTLYDTLSGASTAGTTVVEAIFTQGAAESAGESAIESTVVLESTQEGTACFTAENAQSSAVSDAIEQVTVSGLEPAEAYGVSYAFRFADQSEGLLTVEGGMRAVNQAAEAIKETLPFLLLVILCISLLGSYVYARFITRPIVALSRISRQMAALDFKARFHKKRRDEIGALGESLNALSDSLSAALLQLQTANAQLQSDIDRERELDRQRLAFFSAASHELKTPVTILKGQLSGMLAQVGVYRDREKYLARALAVTGRMESLIQEILTISRIDSGHFSQSFSPLDLSALLEKQLTQYTELLEQKRFRLETAVESGAILTGNESLLAHVLDNVLINALLYSPPGATIRVCLRFPVLIVENTGVLLPDASFPHLFTPFYRVESSRNRKSGGSGLGLYLVRSILSLHGADCSLENTEDGVRFTARFTDRSPPVGTIPP